MADFWWSSSVLHSHRLQTLQCELGMADFWWSSSVLRCRGARANSGNLHDWQIRQLVSKQQLQHQVAVSLHLRRSARQLKDHGVPDDLQGPSKLRKAWHSFENRFVRFFTDENSLEEDYRRKKELDRTMALTRVSKHYVVKNA